MKPSFGRDLTTGSIPRHIVAFSIPMLVGSFLQTAYSFVNAIWVGRFLGTEALAAVTVSFPVVFVLFSIGMGLTMATSILVSQSYGARRMDELRRVVDSSTLLIYALGLVLTLLGEWLAPTILTLMATPPEIHAESVSYLRIFLLSMPLGFGLFLTRSLLQGVGDSKTPLYFQAASLLLTTVLDPILIFGWMGLPKLGLNGTAWATVVSQLLALTALIIYLRKKDVPVAPRMPRLGHLGPTTLKTLRIGVPAAVQQSLVSIGMVFVTGIVNSFGEVATAAFGAASRIDQIAFMPAMTFGMAVSTLAGQNLGAGRYDRVQEIFKWGCLFSGGITLLISLVAVSFPEALLRIFISDPAVIAPGVSYLHIVGTTYVLFALIFVSNGIINGAGRTFVTTVFSLVSLWVVRVPVAYWLSHRMNSVTGVWLAMALSFAVSLAVSMAYYFSGRWRTPLVKKAPEGPAAPNPGEVFGHETGEA
ncbi:MATE family efflux transporter [Myxococcus sp. AS-1-15]|uniref:MATE family efflux transporter n=1 Tax=Myxococcus sp. AS-1-15 TaxID=2874600 RepID=UPI001CBAE453|nr:MATE family efflux transporter [Myxococcus sp. AS-1-15]MBZ4395521.1 MATE family efflux transporter [Myxococcus sp. AS-1-15]